MKVIHKDATITNTDDDGPGAFEVVLSAPTLDRDGDTLLPEEWKQPLPDHITFDSDHGMSVATTVGSGVPRIDEKTGNLIVSGTYSSLPRAQEVRTLVNEGHIRTTSVAFMSQKSTKDGVSTVTRELLNGAFVAIPSNREALVLSSKGLKAGARNSKTDAERIQAIHDHALALGATPASEDGKAFRRDRQPADGIKSIAGSLEATQDRARDALQDTYPGAWVYLRGTIPDGNGGGTLVYSVEDADTYDQELFRQSYTDDGSVITLTGDPAPVDVMEVITPDPDEERETDATGAAPAPATGASAPVAGTRSAPVNDAEALELQARAARLRLLGTLTNS